MNNVALKKKIIKFNSSSITASHRSATIVKLPKRSARIEWWHKKFQGSEPTRSVDGKILQETRLQMHLRSNIKINRN